MKKIVLLIALALWCFLPTSNSFLFGQSKADCLVCHSDSSLTKEKEGKQISLFVNETILGRSPHKKFVCVACHTGFNPENLPHKENIEPVNCLTCHKDVGVKHTFHPQLGEAILSHKEPDISCKDCHGTHDVVSPKLPESKFSQGHLVESCGDCHADVKQDFVASAHGEAFAAEVKGAPNCLSCHRHNITRDNTGHDTLAQKIAEEKLCLSCHLDNPDVRLRTSPTAGFIASYEGSVHGAALLRGNSRAANCVDCHGNHEMKKGSEPTSFVNRKNIPATCGKCHEGIEKEFNQSVHGIALAKGVTDAPACTSCHGEHTIYSHSDPRSFVSARNVAAQCTSCHGTVKLTQKYGIANDRAQTFADSYHGLALKGGAVDVANCASCHTAHNIKPSTDSTSTVNKANLAATCGKCHPGANKQFAVGTIHVAMTAKEDPALYWIATTYIILIVLVVGGMFIHNMLDFIRKSRRQLMIRRGLLVGEHGGHSLYLRMTLSERLQHGALVVSFALLVITGFMLRYPDAWWVMWIRKWSDSIFELRSLIHRTAAVIMVLAGVYHLYYAFFTQRGKQLIRDLLPKAQDVRDMNAVLRYNLGMTAQKPQFGRFSYIEKSEYWALVWGTIVMAVTGTVMWFDNTFIGLFTKFGYDISRTIHFFEAWLATLAIIVWHFYFVIFNPDVYPMNVAWWKGTLTEAEMEDEHPLELEELRHREMEEEQGLSQEQDKKSGRQDDSQETAVIDQFEKDKR